MSNPQEADKSLWTAIDAYIGEQLLPPDDALEHALQASRAAGLAEIQVPPAQGRFLQLLARSIAARSILEIGTLAGYSTIWLARALPREGRLISLELDPAIAEIARANLAYAGLSNVAEIRVGAAVDLLPPLAAERLRPFDFIFIDADKATTPEYFQWALKLARVGSLIVVDNVVRSGQVLNPASVDPDIQGVRRLHEMLASERRVEATTIQTVCGKGHDGFLLALVVAL